MAPVFLSLSDVLHVHRDQIERYGGEPGVRDIGLLQSAVAMPAAGFGGRFLHGDLFEMAAAYLFHIARNHPFVDGNKRTATVCAIAFLKLNGINIIVSNDTLADFVIYAAQGKKDKPGITAFLKKHSKPSKK